MSDRILLKMRSLFFKLLFHRKLLMQGRQDAYPTGAFHYLRLLNILVFA
jgi:hypothetical protein